jgi:hypothetical protein
VRWVWCTDGSDVEILRDPFEGMVSGHLYVGTEPHHVDDPWMKSNHPARKFEELWKRFGTKTLVNAGVMGGERKVVQDFAQKMVSVYNDIESERFWRWDKSRGDTGDMAAFNYVAYFEYGSRLIHGPEITTDFKAFRDNGKAKFKHK